MVVTGIFHLEAEDFVSHSRGAVSDEIFEEKIAQTETLVSMRARSLHQAMLLRKLLWLAGAQNVEIDAQAA